MKTHVRKTRLALGKRETPAWVAERKRLGLEADSHNPLPDWNCPTPPSEQEFKQFIFSELDRRLEAETDAMAAKVQSADNLAAFMGVVAAGWRPPQGTAFRRRGRPKADPVARLFVDAEEAALLTTTVREIFEDYWNKWNRGRPSAEELAAEYVGIKVGKVRVRKKRQAKRRPSI